MPFVVCVLDQPLPRVEAGGHQRRNHAAVHEVVEHGLQRRVVQVVAAVVDDEQGVATLGIRIEARREVQRDAGCPAERRAHNRVVLERSLGRLGVGPGPLGDGIAVGLAHRVPAKGVVRPLGVERVLDQPDAAVLGHLELVLDPRAARQLESEDPQIRAGEPFEAEVGRQPDPPVAQVHGIGRASVDEHAGVVGHDRQLAPGDEGFDGIGRQLGRHVKPAGDQLAYTLSVRPTSSSMRRSSS